MNAYVVPITEVHPIPGADRIERVVSPLGQTVAPKGAWVVGDKAVFVMAGAVPPDTALFCGLWHKKGGFSEATAEDGQTVTLPWPNLKSGTSVMLPATCDSGVIRHVVLRPNAQDASITEVTVVVDLTTAGWMGDLHGTHVDPEAVTTPRPAGFHIRRRTIRGVQSDGIFVTLEAVGIRANRLLGRNVSAVVGVKPYIRKPPVDDDGLKNYDLSFVDKQRPDKVRVWLRMRHEGVDLHACSDVAKAVMVRGGSPPWLEDVLSMGGVEGIIRDIEIAHNARPEDKPWAAWARENDLAPWQAFCVELWLEGTYKSGYYKDEVELEYGYKIVAKETVANAEAQRRWKVFGADSNHALWEESVDAAAKSLYEEGFRAHCLENPESLFLVIEEFCNQSYDNIPDTVRARLHSTLQANMDAMGVHPSIPLGVGEGTSLSEALISLWGNLKDSLLPPSMTAEQIYGLPMKKRVGWQRK